jgi:hypothetical protein
MNRFMLWIAVSVSLTLSTARALTLEEARTRLRLPEDVQVKGWFINQGQSMGVGEDWFTISALMQEGH